MNGFDVHKPKVTSKFVSDDSDVVRLGAVHPPVAAELGPWSVYAAVLGVQFVIVCLILISTRPCTVMTGGDRVSTPHLNVLLVVIIAACSCGATAWLNVCLRTNAASALVDAK